MNWVMPKALPRSRRSCRRAPRRQQQAHRGVSVLFPQRLVLGAGAREPGVQHIGLADLAAVIGLDAEDGDQRGRIDLILLADGVQLRADLLHHHLAVGHALVVDRLGDVVPPALAASGWPLAEDTVVGSSLAPAVYLSQSASVRPLAVAPLRSLSRQALVSSAVGMMTTGSAVAAGAAVAAGTAVGAGAGAGAAVRGGRGRFRREPRTRARARRPARGARRQRAGSGRRRGFGRGRDGGRGGGRGGRQRRVVEAALGCQRRRGRRRRLRARTGGRGGLGLRGAGGGGQRGGQQDLGKGIDSKTNGAQGHGIPKNRTQPRSYRVPMMKSNRRWPVRRQPPPAWEEAGAARAGTAPAPPG